MKSGKAVKAVYNAGAEHYHFNMAIAESGEKKVIDEMIANIRTDENLSYPDSCVKAGTQFNTIKGLEEGKFNFKEMRQRLKSDSRSPLQNLSSKGCAS